MGSRLINILIVALMFGNSLQAARDTQKVLFKINENGLDWCNLESPAKVSIKKQDSLVVTALVEESGITDSDNPDSSISAWIGYSKENTSPSSEDWHWISADYIENKNGRSCYAAQIGSHIEEAGNYYYTSRFSLDSTNFQYGGYSESGGGFWDGETNVSGRLYVTVGVQKEGMPQKFQIYPPYPNPFNPLVNIKLDIPQTTQLTIHIFDIRGRLLETLHKDQIQPGYQKFTWQANSYSSGLYILQVLSPLGSQTFKILLVK